jgi:hypothetical protein
MKLLETTTVSKLRDVLSRTDWMKRIEREPILVDRRKDGTWTLEAWAPNLGEAWFPSPDGGYFVAFRTQGHGIWVGPDPVEIPEPFLALHGKAWSAMGPKSPRAPTEYKLEDLFPYLGVARRTAS